MKLNEAFYLKFPIVVYAKFELHHYLEGIQKYKITHTNIVPPMVILLAKHPSVEKYDLSSLKIVNSGAAPLSSELQLAVLKRLKTPVRQAYGMTETAPCTTASPYFPGVIPKLGASGLLVPNVELKVISPETGEAVGENKEGELCFRCPNIMRGYYKNTESIIDKDGFLHSGDVGYMDQDGWVYVVDRVKELIKYKGFQVAPAELEAVLLQHPKVLDCAVIGKPDPLAGELPFAYVVLKPNETCQISDIYDFVASKVTHYKHLRGGIALINQIPKSTSGKILRRFLRDKLKTEITAKL